MVMYDENNCIESTGEDELTADFLEKEIEKEMDRDGIQGDDEDEEALYLIDGFD